ncbi:calcyphosin-like protein [Patiria miniata]|uniref:EF-hand domain-containing protein n=1 Tax=Patiria miniata TaxID=46514 RepID=A0A913Z9U6_PATMI|nr:calcyphosin-like protein [Patiria miniata]XP_038048554.1 calcyphosin-like protein [Patiria miniata]
MEQLRQKLLERNVNSFKRLGRKFRIMDDDRSGSLNQEEFVKGVRDMGVDMSQDEIKNIFGTLDKDGSGTLSIDEFLETLAPPLNATRKDIIKQAFAKFDKTGDEIVTVADLKGIYNVRCHPDFTSGAKTEEQLMTEFLNSFEPDEASRDGKVTLAEFEKYYAGVSSGYDSDEHFSLMMRNSYKL